MHDRYASRPPCLEEMCLAQFATTYTYTSRVPKKIEFSDGRSIKVFNDGKEVEQNSSLVLFHTNTKLPKYIKLQNEDLGMMRARTFPIVMKIHASNKKEGHEQYYSELVLFCHWRNEIEEFQRWFPDECYEIYQNRIEELQANKDTIYPGQKVLELLDAEDFNAERPTHIFDLLDSQREQENADDNEIGSTDDPKYKSFGVTDQLGQESNHENYQIKVLSVRDDELKFLTERLVPEQMDVLNKVVQYCKEVIRLKNPNSKVEPVRLIIHGGAGKSIIIHEE